MHKPPPAHSSSCTCSFSPLAAPLAPPAPAEPRVSSNRQQPNNEGPSPASPTPTPTDPRAQQSAIVNSHSPPLPPAPAPAFCRAWAPRTTAPRSSAARRWGRWSSARASAPCWAAGPSHSRHWRRCGGAGRGGGDRARWQPEGRERFALQAGNEPDAGWGAPATEMRRCAFQRGGSGGRPTAQPAPPCAPTHLPARRLPSWPRPATLQLLPERDGATRAAALGAIELAWVELGEDVWRHLGRWVRSFFGRGLYVD